MISKRTLFTVCTSLLYSGTMRLPATGCAPVSAGGQPAIVRRGLCMEDEGLALGLSLIHICTLGDDVFFWKESGGPYGTSGVPDIICCYKGRFLGLEAKLPGGRLTPLQLSLIHI